MSPTAWLGIVSACTIALYAFGRWFFVGRNKPRQTTHSETIVKGQLEALQAKGFRFGDDRDVIK